MNEVPTYAISIYLGGDCETAKRWLRRECYQHGLCVTVQPTTFIYTGGEEGGVVIGLVNYPRFPATHEVLWARASEIAGGLIVELCQRSALVVAPDRTCWITTLPPGAS